MRSESQSVLKCVSQLVDSQCVHFLFAKNRATLSTQEQHGRRWSLAYFGVQRFVRTRFMIRQNGHNSNFLRTAVKAFNKKALELPETMPRAGLESVESSKKTPLKHALYSCHRLYTPNSQTLVGRYKSNIRNIVKPRLNRDPKTTRHCFIVVFFGERKRQLRSFCFWYRECICHIPSCKMSNPWSCHAGVPKRGILIPSNTNLQWIKSDPISQVIVFYSFIIIILYNIHFIIIYHYHYHSVSFSIFKMTKTTFGSLFMPGSRPNSARSSSHTPAGAGLGKTLECWGSKGGVTWKGCMKMINILADCSKRIMDCTIGIEIAAIARRNFLFTERAAKSYTHQQTLQWYLQWESCSKVELSWDPSIEQPSQVLHMTPLTPLAIGMWVAGSRPGSAVSRQVSGRALASDGCVGFWREILPTFEMSNEKKPGCLVYIGDCTTELYRDYNKPLQGSLLIKPRNHETMSKVQEQARIPWLDKFLVEATEATGLVWGWWLLLQGEPSSDRGNEDCKRGCSLLHDSLRYLFRCRFFLTRRRIAKVTDETEDKIDGEEGKDNAFGDAEKYPVKPLFEDMLKSCPTTTTFWV